MRECAILCEDGDTCGSSHCSLSSLLPPALSFQGADVLTCSNDYFVGDSPPTLDYVPRGRWVPLGAATTVGMFQVGARVSAAAECAWANHPELTPLVLPNRPLPLPISICTPR